MRNWKLWFVAASASAALAAGPAPVAVLRADDTAQETKTGTEGEEPPEIEKADPTGKAKVLATRYGVKEEDVLKLRTEQEMGWGELSHLYAIARKSGQTPETILQLRKDGMGWGEIAKKYDLKLGHINKEVREDHRAMKRAERGTPRFDRREDRMERREHRMKSKDRPGSFHPSGDRPARTARFDHPGRGWGRNK